MSDDAWGGPWADQLERAVLAAWGLDPGQAPIQALAKVYESLSDALIEAETSGRQPSAAALAAKPGVSRELLGAVWGLVYGFRTAAVARWLLGRLPQLPERVAELGSGWGPFGWAAAGLGAREVLLVDAVAEAFRGTPAVFEGSGLARPRQRVGGPGQVEGGFDLVALPYSLGEIVRSAGDPAAAGARLLAELLGRVRPGGRVVVLEAGTRTSATRLQAIRDLLARDAVPIEGPCAGAARCPVGAIPGDWCHFTWSVRPGPVARAVSEAAGRRWDQLHLSWLVLGGGSPAEVRLLERRDRGKGKVEARLCTAQGLVAVTALRRNGTALAALEGVEVGRRVGWDASALEPRGDGLRLGGPSLWSVPGV